MAEDMRKIDNGRSKLMSRFAAEKKKSAIAVSLISLMLFMWVRVFMGKSPESADASLMMESAQFSEEMNSEVKVSFIELPKVKGRNDVLSRDFFSSDGREGFPGGQAGMLNRGQVNVVSEEGRENIVRRIANKLNLEAIELTDRPRVFINDKLLVKGDKLRVMDGNRRYECEVIEIERNAVSLRCGEAMIKLKLAETAGVLD